MAQHVLLVLYRCFVRWEVSGHTFVVLKGAASRICLKQHTASLYSFPQTFSPGFSLDSK